MDSGRGDDALEEPKRVSYGPPQESCQDVDRVLAAPLGAWLPAGLPR